MSFADRLQNLRKAKGLSQEELAEKCSVSRQSVSKWETGLGYPETEKLLILCEILEVNLDFLLRDKSDTLQEKIEQEETVSYMPYVGKWVQVFLNDKEFQGFYCIALIAIWKSYLFFMDDKGKHGLLNEVAVRSISEFSNGKKPKREFPNPSCREEVCNTNYFLGKKCEIRLRQEGFISLLGTGFVKPGGFYSATIESISHDAVNVLDQHDCKHTVKLADVLFIKEC